VTRTVWNDLTRKRRIEEVETPTIERNERGCSTKKGSNHLSQAI